MVKNKVGKCILSLLFVTRERIKYLTNRGLISKGFSKAPISQIGWGKAPTSKKEREGPMT